MAEHKPGPGETLSFVATGVFAVAAVLRVLTEGASADVLLVGSAAAAILLGTVALLAYRTRAGRLGAEHGLWITVGLIGLTLAVLVVGRALVS